MILHNEIILIIINITIMRLIIRDVEKGKEREQKEKSFLFTWWRPDDGSFMKAYSKKKKKNWS